MKSRVVGDFAITRRAKIAVTSYLSCSFPCAVTLAPAKSTLKPVFPCVALSGCGTVSARISLVGDPGRALSACLTPALTRRLARPLRPPTCSLTSTGALPNWPRIPRYLYFIMTRVLSKPLPEATGGAIGRGATQPPRRVPQDVEELTGGCGRAVVAISVPFSRSERERRTPRALPQGCPHGVADGTHRGRQLNHHVRIAE